MQTPDINKEVFKMNKHSIFFITKIMEKFIKIIVWGIIITFFFYVLMVFLLELQESHIREQYIPILTEFANLQKIYNEWFEVFMLGIVLWIIKILFGGF